LPTNMPIVPLADLGEPVEGQETRPQPYNDTPLPKRFGTASPLDPQTFATSEESATTLAQGEADPRYSPLEVATWIDDLAERALRHLEAAEEHASNPAAPPLRRLAIDVRIQTGVGRYYGEKLRAGVAYALYRRTGDLDVLR